MPKSLIRYNFFNPRTTCAKTLQNLFRKWNGLLSRATFRLARSKHPDCPFWYGERSQVGWLAIAAHETGWLPLQEAYVARKGKGGGRTDLWGIQGRGESACIYDFEAKFANLNLSTLKSYNSFVEVDDIRGKLRWAMRQAKSKKNDYAGDVGVGLVFILLYARNGTTRSEQIDLLKDFKKAATNKSAFAGVNADFLALYVAGYSSVVNVVKANKGKYEPSLGVAVLGRFA